MGNSENTRDLLMVPERSPSSSRDMSTKGFALFLSHSIDEIWFKNFYDHTRTFSSSTPTHLHVLLLVLNDVVVGVNILVLNYAKNVDHVDSVSDISKMKLKEGWKKYLYIQTNLPVVELVRQPCRGRGTKIA